MPDRLVRLKLIVAYDGGPYLGWQSQKGGNTVQDILEGAFAAILGGRTAVHGAGRTDAGVHALGQCAHADVEGSRLAPWEWRNALNARLPKEIRILRCTRANAAFHARFSARGKIYTYRIWNDVVLPPFEAGRAWHLVGKIDMDILQNRAALLAGKHDFAGFSANRGHPPADTVRELSKVRARKRGPLLTLTFQGTGFLYKMARLMTGTLVRCAQGKADPALVLETLGGKKTSFAAPAEGLCLTRVLY